MTLARCATPGAVLGPWLHCGDGHEPVEWKSRPACWICGGDGIKGQVSQWKNTSSAYFEERQ